VSGDAAKVGEPFTEQAGIEVVIILLALDYLRSSA
jgi:hypothetical protein